MNPPEFNQSEAETNRQNVPSTALAMPPTFESEFQNYIAALQNRGIMLSEAHQKDFFQACTNKWPEYCNENRQNTVDL